jgi:phage protein D
VKARWNNVSGGALQYLLVGGGGANTTETASPPTLQKTDARNAAETELAQLQAGAGQTLSLQLVKGPPRDCCRAAAEKSKGIKEAIDSMEWVIKRVVHTIDEGSGFTTSIDAEVYQASVPVESEPEEEEAPEGE